MARSAVGDPATECLNTSAATPIESIVPTKPMTKAAEFGTGNGGAAHMMGDVGPGSGPPTALMRNPSWSTEPTPPGIDDRNGSGAIPMKALVINASDATAPRVSPVVM